MSPLLCFGFLGVLLCFLTPIVASDEESAFYEYAPHEYPNLIRQPKSCSGPNRNPPTSVCDPENMLSRSEAQRIDTLIEQNSNGTYCFCQSCEPHTSGLHIKIAVVQSFKQKPNSTLSESLRHFAEYIRTDWNVSPNCHNDVIIFVSTVFNKIHISRGAKAERVLSSSTVSRLIEDSITYLKYGDVSKCLEKLVKSINVETKSYDPRLDKLGLNNGFFLLLVAGGISLLVIIIVVYTCHKRDTTRRRKLRNQNRQQTPDIVATKTDQSGTLLLNASP